MADALEVPVCTMCDNAGTRRCGVSKAIHYCSAACQRMDWPIHKIVCKDYAQFEGGRPDKDHYSAIYFHPEHSQPRFVWVSFDHGHQLPSVTSLHQCGFDEYGAAVSVKEFPKNPMLGRHIEPHHLNVAWPDAAIMGPNSKPRPQPNQSLIKVNQELADFFRGPVLAVGKHCGQNSEKKASDLDLKPSYFRHLVDNLRMTYCDSEADAQGLTEEASIRAVRINCEGDTIFCDRPGFEQVLQPKSALLLPSEIPSPVADNIGIPLIISKVAPAVVWRDSRRPCRMKNYRAAILDPPNQTIATGSLILVSDMR